MSTASTRSREKETIDASISSGNESDNSVNYLASLTLIWPFLRTQKLKMVATMCIATFSVALELIPIYIIYSLLRDTIHSSITMNIVLLYSLIALVAIIGSYLLLGIAMTLSHIIAFETLYRLRSKIANHLAYLPLGYFSRKRSGDAKKLLIDDPEKLELVIAHGIPEGISALTTWLAVSIWLFYVDWRMSIAAMVITPISFYLLIKGMKKGSNFASDYQSSSQAMNASIVEYLNGLAIIKIFNKGTERYRETENSIKHYADVEKQWGSAYLPLGGTFFSLVLSNVVFIVLLGSGLILNGTLETITFVFFIIVGANYSRPLLKLFHLFHELAHISMSSQSAHKVLNTPHQPDNGNNTNLADFTVKFKNVSFKYDDQYVLHNINLTANQNEITALVGPSGAGKSTLATLIPRFYDINEGTITIGDIDIKKMSIEQLMDTVSFVFQDTFLFTGTIENNIRFGVPSASHQQVIDAAKSAQIHDFIESLPQGYSTQIGDKGRKLSGGENQRLAIARAIIKNAPVIILDEATAFADPENEALIQRAIESLTQGKTVIIIAHRLNTIQNVDHIVVIDEGKIAEQGQHNQLLDLKGIYHRQWLDFCALRNESQNPQTSMEDMTNE